MPYHQNVYDLLGIEPGESPEAARLIADHEAAHGPLPASVREWYSVPNVVLLAWENAPQYRLRGTIWSDPSDCYSVVPLRDVLSQFAAIAVDRARDYVWIMDEFQGVTHWMVEVNESDDPPVRRDDSGRAVRDNCVVDSATFSDFIAGWFGSQYFGGWFPPALRLSNPRGTAGTALEQSLKPYANGLWLRAPAEPFAPPVIDFLTEQLGEPGRTPRPGNVTTHAFRPAGGTIRVTADEPGLGGALSAWWMHAESPEHLADLARLVTPFGTLRETLRADTDVAREVLRQFTGERPA